MKSKNGYQVIPFSAKRNIVAKTLSIGREQNNIYLLQEVDISLPRKYITDHYDQTGEKLSLTAYIVKCLADTFEKFPQMNSIRKGRKLIVMDDVTVGVLVERQIAGEPVPENVGIQAVQHKSYRHVMDEIRQAQMKTGADFGALTDAEWVNLIPGFMFRSFVRLASKNIAMIKRFGAVAVTSIGMFSRKDQASWPIPIVGGATVSVAVGSIIERLKLVGDEVKACEHICLTVTFNHDIVDGAPAARFVKLFTEKLSSGELIAETIGTYVDRKNNIGNYSNDAG